MCGGRVAADREWMRARHQKLTDPAHRQAAGALRRQRLTVARRPTGPETQTRPSAGYDIALRPDGIS